MDDKIVGIAIKPKAISKKLIISAMVVIEEMIMVRR